MSRQSILIVDDKPDMLEFLSRLLQSELDVDIHCADNGDRALEHLRHHACDVVVTDIRMPGMDGLELLQRIKQADREAIVILMTAYGSIEKAVESLKLGAYDFITKPFDEERLLHTLKKALEHEALKRRTRDLSRRVREQQVNDRLIGQSMPMNRLVETINLVAKTDVTVLITGETGTGKELVARMIHDLSARADGPLVTVNCAAIPEEILESELFGHRRGAFTGARSDRAGLFVAAEGGSIVLDEIGDMAPALQTKLLRVLQDKELRPLGADRTRPVDVRIIAATNQNLQDKIRKGDFREDLYHRLACVAIHTPALRDIPEDIPLIANHLLLRYNREMGTNKKISDQALRYLVERRWTGNVRELENAIKRALIFAKTDQLMPEDFDCELSVLPGSRDYGTDLCERSYPEAKRAILEKFTVHYMTGLLERTGGNVSRAAKLAGIERQSLQQLLKRYRISADRFRNRHLRG
ncbi:sigma-54-dependent transcriptional regulator [Thermodesulfobacteriota bacterium B35]